VIISDTTIEDVEAMNGGGIEIAFDYGEMTIRDSTIRNAKASDYAGGIYCYETGNVTISGTTIENVTANRGPCIAIYNTTLQLRLNNVYNGTLLSTQAAITNLRNSGAIYVSGSSQVTVIP